MKGTRILMAAALAATAWPAHAQDIGGVFDMGGLTGTASMDPVIEQSREMAIQQGEGDPLPGRPRSQALMTALSQGLSLRGGAMNFTGNQGGAAVSRADMRYTPSAQLRRKNLAMFVEKTRAADPVGAAQLEQAFRSDIIAQIDSEIGRFEMSADNVANAYTVWWISAWLADRGLTRDPTMGEVQAVNAQVERALSSTPAFASAPDATKQEMAEACLIQAAVIGAYMSNANGDKKQLRRISDAIRQGARKMGIDLRTMELTEAGFRPRTSGEAGVPKGETRRLAGGATPAGEEGGSGQVFGYTLGIGTAAGLGWLLFRRAR